MKHCLNCRLVKLD